MSRLSTWWRRLDPAEQAQWTGVALCMALFCVHQVVYAEWYIEDAAITFTYARHAATGEGWTAFPGGPVVEGFSNPTWTALLAITDFVGFSPWLSAKLYGLLFGLLTLPMAFLWAREASGDRGLLPVLAPLVLATSPQFAIWTTSGLENGLFGWLLALGSVELLRELRTGGSPWSALPFGLLSITRPEAAVYVATAGLLAFVLSVRERKGAAVLRLVVWTGLVLTPFLLYEAYRLWVFAWPLPNTYYAKLAVEEEQFHPLNWSIKGWPYVRGWALQSAWGFLLPLLALVATGLRGFAGKVGGFFAIALVLVFLPGLAWPHLIPGFPEFTEPLLTVRLRLGVMAGAVLLLPWLGTDRPGANARILAWYLTANAIAFAIYSGGDWMDGFRWLNMGVIPLAVLLADGVSLAANAVSWRDPVYARRMISAVLAGPIVIAGVAQTSLIRQASETSPHDVYRRVRYMQTVQDRLHVDNIVNADVDFGAQMWWTGDRLIDLAGLVDAPMGHHAWQRPFVKEYLFGENPPDFAHMHGGWKGKVGVALHPEWRREYLLLPHYVASRKFLHVGNFIRKDLFIAKKWPGTNRRKTAFLAELTLTGLDIPAPEVVAGQGVYVHLGWSTTRSRRPDFRALFFVEGQGRFWVQDLPVGYDWYPPVQWRRGEVIQGRHTLPLPDDLPPGDYTLGVVLIGVDGVVIPASRPSEDPQFAAGEVRWDAAFTVMPLEEVREIVSQELDHLHELTADGQCDDAATQLQQSRRHLDAHDPHQPYVIAANRAEMARCWARRAQHGTEEQAVRDISQARLWDHRDPLVHEIAQELADVWEFNGDRALEDGDDNAAYSYWRHTLLADPTRTWVMRRAEEARDRRLELEPT